MLPSWSFLTLANSGAAFVGSQKISWFWQSRFEYKNSTYDVLVLLTTSEVSLAGFIQTRKFLNALLSVFILSLKKILFIYFYREGKGGKKGEKH